MAARRSSRTSGASAPEEGTATSVESDLSAPKTLADFGAESAATTPSDDEVEALKAADFAEDETADEDAVEVADVLRRKFIEGEEDAPAEDEPTVADLDTSNARELGGDVLVVVLFDYYRVRHEGVFVLAHKGEVLKVDDATADRGVAIGGLHKIEG